jgi:hypothetical protein
MLSALPRVYEEGSTGAAVPSEPEPTLIGGDVQVERLTAASAEAKKRLDVEVAQPIRQWMAAYRTVSERLRRLESLRLELDSRRRTVAELQGKVERVRANLGTTRAKGEAEVEATLRRMQHKEDKMARCAAAYGESEATLYNSLFTLIKDTSVLRDYCAAAILIVQEAFAAGYAAFEPPMMIAGGGVAAASAAPVVAAAPAQQPTAYQPAAPVPAMGGSSSNAAAAGGKYAGSGKGPANQQGGAGNNAEAKVRREEREMTTPTTPLPRPAGSKEKNNTPAPLSLPLTHPPPTTTGPRRPVVHPLGRRRRQRLLRREAGRQQRAGGERQRGAARER